MKRNKPGMPEITREIYKGVKKFDRQEFQTFCRELYAYGYQDGRNSVPRIDLEKVCEELEATKGIGAKKLTEIRAILVRHLGETSPES